MAAQVAIAVARSEQIAAYALVDDEDYERVARYRWLMQGTPEAPGYVYRSLSPTERRASGRRDRGLGQEILRQPGRLTFRNGNRLDFRTANLISRQERQRRLEEGAQRLLEATPPCPYPDTDAACEIALTKGWTVWVDPAWAERLGRYHWSVSIRRQHVYVKRVGRRASGQVTSIYMARVIAGLQELEEGTRLRPGVVTYHRPPDVEHHRLDLRATNLVVTTRGGINLRRLTRTPSRGVQRRGQRYRAQIKIGGQERILGLYETPDAAAQAREAELLRLGLHDIARHQTERVTQEGAVSTTGNTGRRDGL